MNSGFRQFKILNCLKCQQFKGHNSGNCRLVGLLQLVARSPICVFKLKVEARQVIKDQSNHMSASRQERNVCAFNIYKSPHQQFYHPWTFMGQLLWRNNKKDCSVFTVQIHGGQWAGNHSPFVATASDLLHSEKHSKIQIMGNLF